MKVGVVMESEMYAHGIEKYLKSMGQFYIGVKLFNKSELNDEACQRRFLKFITSWKLLVMDFNSYCCILSIIKKNPEILDQFTGKLVLVRMGCNYVYRKEDIIPDRFKSLKLVIDLSIPPSITCESFKRLVLPMLFPKMSHSIRVNSYDSANLNLSPEWKVV